MIYKKSYIKMVSVILICKIIFMNLIEWIYINFIYGNISIMAYKESHMEIRVIKYLILFLLI